MEASYVNFVEPGDVVVIGVNGFFADRMTQVASRCGAKVIRVEEEWGKIIEPEKMIKTLKEHPEAKICGVVHGGDLHRGETASWRDWGVLPRRKYPVSWWML